MQSINSTILSLKRFLCFSFWFAIVLFSSCRKFVTADAPVTQISGATIYESDATATASVLSIYSFMWTNSYRNAWYNGLSADEFNDHSTSTANNEFYKSSLLPSNAYLGGHWSLSYQLIYYANSAIEGLNASDKITSDVKKQLSGEAKFLRAYFYFHLINQFGDVPLITTTDYRANRLAVRTPKTQVFQQIVTDLKDAQSLLKDSYVSAINTTTNDRVRPNKWAASALLAKVYLYLENWAAAEAEATIVLSNSSLYSLPPNLNNVFTANSNEAIWQLSPSNNLYNTYDGNYFILVNDPANSALQVSLSPELLNSFEVGDNRKNSWVSSIVISGQTFYFPYKYKVKAGVTGIPVTEYTMVLRLAEQYLIRAEARAKQNNISGAQSDINAIRNRAGLGNTTANTQALLFQAVEQERKIELFTEWGNRWYDLKRTDRANAVLGVIKGATWQPTDMLYPIPQSEILKDPNLTQNPGY